MDECSKLYSIDKQEISEKSLELSLLSINLLTFHSLNCKFIFSLINIFRYYKVKYLIILHNKITSLSDRKIESRQLQHLLK